MGGASADYGYSIALDGSGNVYTTGYFQGTADFDPGAPVYNLTSVGFNEIFVSKLDASGNFVWAISMGGASADYGYSIAVDVSGNVYIMGDQYSPVVDYDPGAGTFNLSNTGIEANFIARYDNNGNFLCAMTIKPGHNETDVNRHLAVNGSNVWVAAIFDAAAADFDPCPPFYNPGVYGSYDIYVAKYNFSGCSCGIMPVELLAFAAECKAPSEIVLNWTTASEINNDYFTVERSQDVTLSGVEGWETIGTVDGAGNSSTAHNYSFTDQLSTLEPSNFSTVYYRLKQTDHDGQFTYSDVVALDNCHALSAFIIYPNPASDELFVEIFSRQNEGTAQLQITDLLGRTVRTEKLNLQAGNNTRKISLKDFSSGMYFISLMNGEIITKKFIKSAN